MRSRYEQQDSVDPSTYRQLQVLREVAQNPEVSQRELSSRAGIALGLTNVLLRNLVQKGYIRATKASWKRWLYVLTPEGISHKIRLTYTYVTRVLDHYQRVRQTLREELEPLALHSESRVAIYGTGEFAELVFLGLKEFGIEEIDVFSPSALEGQMFLGMPVGDAKSLRPNDYDRVVIALLTEPDTILQELQDHGVPPHQLVAFFANGKSIEGEG